MRRWIKGEQPIGGGSKRDDVVTQGRATELSELVLLVKQIGRNTTHYPDKKENGNLVIDFEYENLKRVVEVKEKEDKSKDTGDYFI